MIQTEHPVDCANQEKFSKQEEQDQANNNTSPMSGDEEEDKGNGDVAGEAMDIHEEAKFVFNLTGTVPKHKICLTSPKSSPKKKSKSKKSI